jgi:hypothetical protein
MSTHFLPICSLVLKQIRLKSIVSVVLTDLMVQMEELLKRLWPSDASRMHLCSL